MSYQYKNFNQSFESDIWLYFIAALLGSSLTLAFAPFNIWLGLLVSFSGLLYCLELLSQKANYSNYGCHSWSSTNSLLPAFSLGYCFGFGHFISALSWVHNSLTASPEIGEIYGWLKPIVTIIMPGVMGLFTGFVTLGTYILVMLKRDSTIVSRRISILLFFVLSWWFWEWVISYLVIPFPWMVLGYASQYSLVLMQNAALYSVHGLSFILLIIATVLYARSFRYTIIVVLLICFIVSYGQWRLAGNIESGIEFELEPNPITVFNPEQNSNLSQVSNQKKQIQIILTQPNLKLFESTFANSENKNNQIMKTMELSLEGLNKVSSLIQSQNGSLPTLIIWPESGVRSIISRRDDLEFVRYLLPENTILLTGADTYDGVGYYNSMIAIDNSGQIIRQYDKKILAPFGEYIPGASLFSWIHPLVANEGFKHGKRNQIIDLIFDYNIANNTNRIRLVPFICYEIAFPFMVESIDCDFIIQITNDIWFGDSIGPYQHLAIARMRAIEYGKPLLRVANTGISAVIDSNGRVLKFLPLNKTGVINLIVDLANN